MRALHTESRWNLRAPLPLLALAFAVALPLRAQDSSCLHRTVVANVVDANGVPVPGLNAADFQAKFRGKPARLDAATMNREPRRILLLVDASASMVGLLQKNKGLLVEILADFTGDSDPRSSFALVTIADDLQKRMDFTRDRVALRDQVLALQNSLLSKPAGKAKLPLWDSILSATTLFRSPHPGDAIFAVTDGGSSHSKHRRSEVLDSLLAPNLRFFAFILETPHEDHPYSDEDEGPKSIASFAQTTGGFAVTSTAFSREPDWINTGAPPNHAALKLILTGLQREISSYYALNLELSENPDKPRDWELKLVDPMAKSNGKVLLYPRKLLPCSPDVAQK